MLVFQEFKFTKRLRPLFFIILNKRGQSRNRDDNDDDDDDDNDDVDDDETLWYECDDGFVRTKNKDPT